MLDVIKAVNERLKALAVTNSWYLKLGTDVPADASVVIEPLISGPSDIDLVREAYPISIYITAPATKNVYAHMEAATKIRDSLLSISTSVCVRIPSSNGIRVINYGYREPNTPVLYAKVETVLIRDKDTP